MIPDRIVLIASVIVFCTGAFWGIYWLPVRAMGDMGLAGAWGTAAIAGAAAVLLSPVCLLRWSNIQSADPLAIASVALGGVAFTFYSVGFVYGRVAIIILLYFLTPVWSALIGRYLMGWHTPVMRVWAIVIGLLGLFVMLGATGDAPVPQNIGEWMALVGGVLWSFATTGMRAKSNLVPMAAAFIFATGATIAALILAPTLEPLPDLAEIDYPWSLLALAFGTGGIWWALSISCLMWATVRLEPVRVGILLMTEVLVGAVSAALLAGEVLKPLEILGGALVLLAGLLEIWAIKRPNQRLP